MSTHRNSPRRRLASKRLRRVVTDTCRWLRRNTHEDAADRALTAIETAQRKGGR